MTHGPEAKDNSLSRNSAIVASAIFASRIFGLIRDRVLAHYLGTSDAADVFWAAFRIPNLLQNLFGEGVLSAAFIPVYVKLRSNNRDDEADKLASAIFCLLALVMSCLVLIGVFATPLLIDLITPGFEGEKRVLAITLVRILFPGAALLALSAWCLGILNSHRRFLISYTAPVAWNIALIVTLLVFGRRLDQYPLAEALAWGSVVGSALSFGIQLPQVRRFIHRFSFSLGLRLQSVKTVIRHVFPVMISRGVVQISAYVDTLIASFLPGGALATLVYSQTLYTFPVSLFGMSVSAAELPVLSSRSAEDDEAKAYLRSRLDSGLRQIAFFVVPSAVAFFALGDVIAAAIFQTGAFTRSDAVSVWAVLAGSSIGLLANTMGRLYSSMYYALHDTRTPLYYATTRIAVAAVLGYFVALYGPPLLGIEERWGIAGLTASSGCAGWLEYALLKKTLIRRIGKTGLSTSFAARLWIAAALSAAGGWAIKPVVSGQHPITVAIVVLGLYGILYFAVAYVMGIPHAKSTIRRVARITRISR